jgi:predicted nucleic acid binding AN1-type Zn finger protein
MTKCFYCKKKIKNFIIFKCDSCNNVFCVSHMNKHNHNCNKIDKSKIKKKIEKKNPKILNDKFEKI